MLWQAAKGSPFLRFAMATEDNPPILNGNSQVSESFLESESSWQTIDSINSPDINSIELRGSLGSGSAADSSAVVGTYTFTIRCEDDAKLSFSASMIPTKSLPAAASPRLYLRYHTDADESFHGFGESFSYFNLKGLRFPILVSEQGVGRDPGTPLTDYLNTNVAEGVGGNHFTTYAPKSVYLTNYNRSLLLQDSSIVYFNLTSNSCVEIEVWDSLSMSGYIFNRNSWIQLIEAITSVTGRQRGRLPLWSQNGAVVGLEGGSKNVSIAVRSLQDNGVPLAGVWLQDWVGLRHSWDGDRLIWNWELNKDWYPSWDEMVSSWERNGTRVLTYLNPFFSDPQNFTRAGSLTHNFYQEGLEHGYFVKKVDGTPYKMYSLSIEFLTLDVTNPSAVEWMKRIIQNQTLSEAKSSGWMCDFGEYLPMDAVLYNNESAKSFHNKFPEFWGKLTREAIDEVGRGGSDESGVVFFMRSAWLGSPKYVPLFWLGDQLVSWDTDDGLASVITGALSSGLGGHAITHSDIGGYTVSLLPGSGLTYTRTPELLKRWSEFAAFGSGLYRTHIGSSTTSLDAQVYDTPDSMAHFAKFANIFGATGAYRLELMDEAAAMGTPLMRPMAMHFAYDPFIMNDLSSPFSSKSQIQTKQYLYGKDFLVAPALHPGQSNTTVYLPAKSTWIHLWSGNKMMSPEDRGLTLTAPSPIGFPFVCFREESVAGNALRRFVHDMKYDDGYVWECPTEVCTPTLSTSLPSKKGVTGMTQEVIIALSVVAGFLILSAIGISLSRAAKRKSGGLSSEIESEGSSDEKHSATVTRYKPLLQNESV